MTQESPSGIWRWLDRAASGAIAVAAITVTVAALGSFRSTPNAASSLVGVSLGEELRSTRLEPAPTLLVVYAMECRYCVESVPAIRDILADLARYHTRLRRLVVTFNQPEQFRAYIDEHALAFDAIQMMPAGGRLTTVTPRVLWVDERGVVQNDWLGFVDSLMAAEIKAAVAAAVSESASATR